MAVLALDTSASVTVAVVSDDGARLARRDAPERRRHAEALAPLVEAALAEAGVDRRVLTAFAVGTWRARVTARLVGGVTARALGFALGVPVLGVPSLDAVAAQAVSDLGLAPDDELLGATPGRRRAGGAARGRERALAGARSAGRAGGERVVVAAVASTLLDLRNTRRVAAELASLPQQVVLVSHDLALMDAMDRVLVVDGGRVVADDAPGPAVAHYRRLVDAGPG